MKLNRQEINSVTQQVIDIIERYKPVSEDNQWKDNWEYLKSMIERDIVEKNEILQDLIEKGLTINQFGVEQFIMCLNYILNHMNSEEEFVK
jgi:hypothetical protein